MAGYDLHVHSDWSDGKSSVLSLAQSAKEANLDGFALTDHDTVDGWRDIPSAMRKVGISIFPGLEVSAEWEERDVHILGYGFSREDDGLLKMLEYLAESRRGRIYRMVEKLNDLGYAIDVDKVFARVGDGVPGRPHIGQELIERGYAGSMQEVFDNFLGRGCPAYAPRAKLPPWEAVATIVGAGGNAVLAHPGIDDATRVLPQLLEAGLGGLEVYHPSHDEAQERHFLALVERHGLFYTAGSDFHGFRDRSHGAIGARRLTWPELPTFFKEPPYKM